MVEELLNGADITVCNKHEIVNRREHAVKINLINIILKYELGSF